MLEMLSVFCTVVMAIAESVTAVGVIALCVIGFLHLKKH